MTQKYSEDGTVIPVTAIKAGPCFVTQMKKTDIDGYAAVQLGFGSKKNLKKPQQGHLKNISKNLRWLKEFKIDNPDNLKVGDALTASVFSPGDQVNVTGISKGKGFQGVIKRWGFHGANKTHGTKDQIRMPGSSGATGPQHVLKGTKKPGRMGGDQITVKNLEIIEVDPEKNILYVKGAIPGFAGNLLWIKGKGELKLENTEDTKTQKHENPPTGDHPQGDTENAEKPAEAESAKPE